MTFQQAPFGISNLKGYDLSMVLGSYFYVIGISYNKTHFICIWVNISRFKMIITSGYIEDMKISQELLMKN